MLDVDSEAVAVVAAELKRLYRGAADDVSREDAHDVAAALWGHVIDQADTGRDRPTSLIGRLASVLAAALRDSTDPGTYALGVLWEAQQATRRVEHQEAALRLIARTKCGRYTGMRCSDPYSGKVLGNPGWTADSWCDECVAHAALTDTWPVITETSEWGVLHPGGELEPAGILGENRARMLANRVRGALVRQARPNVWVVAP